MTPGSASPLPVVLLPVGTDDDQCFMLYFDMRGVARKYDVVLDADGFSWSRDTPELAQRYRVKIAKDGGTMEGEGTMKKNGGAWEPDLGLSYVRRG